MRQRLRQALPFIVASALFLIALEVLRVELRTVTWYDLRRDIAATPLSRLLLAIGLTAANYAALTGYDQLAFAIIGKRLSRARIALVSFLAYAVSNNVGFAALSGASVRYHFYVRWGVTVSELSRIVVSYSVTFWLGLLGLGGLSLALAPIDAARGLPGTALLAPSGVLLVLVPLAYLLGAAVRKQPLRVWRFELPLPAPRLAAAQVLLSAVEWTLAGAVLYVLLPPSALTFVPFIGAFLIAILLGMVSHVPGGVGVFEGLMVLLLRPYLSSGQLLPALVVYRAVYYLLPLIVAVIVLVADEVRRRREHAARIGAMLGRLTEQLMPTALAAFTFFSGVVLLVSGATPVAASRLELLQRVFPLGLIEASHFLASVVGAVLLILSQGLARRLDAAYFFTATAIVVGMAAALVKGFAYEEAALLLLVFLILRRARPAFDRRAAFFETRFSPEWVVALAAALGASLWLGLFAFKHVDYSNQLWWQFEIHGQASRFLRGLVGAAVVVVLFGSARLLRYAPHEAPEPTNDDLDAAAAIVARQSTPSANLVYLRDKAILFNGARSAFVMYGVQGRTWVALGDPVGPEDQFGDLLREFLERCDDFGGVPVFYEVSKRHLHWYADFGLTFVKLGEEARVDLNAFTLEGPQAAKLRQVVRRLEKDGGSFRVVDPADVPAILPRLREVSDDWLAAKASAEKGFSLGFFDDEYVQRFPIAVVECGGTIVAFANLWRGGEGRELSVDLMRYHRDAPKSVMEALFVLVMNWGKAHGYQWFALGMAPLSGFEDSPVATIWNRLGSFLYEHAESVYNFQGLRAYKEKFHPIWEPRYLAYPGGLRLPLILADVSALVAGGYRKIFRK